MTSTHEFEAATDGIRVDASAFFLPAESDPDHGRYLFGYRIAIKNIGHQRVQLVSRRWLIIDAEGERQEVEGPGVVGQQPLLQPGESFVYHSFCPLPTPWGTMEGAYQMQREDGSRFDAPIDRFFLRHDVLAEAGAQQ